MSNATSKVKMDFEITPLTADRLDHMMKQLRISSYVQLLQMSVALLEVALDAKTKGGHIAIISEDGSQQKIIV